MLRTVLIDLSGTLHIENEVIPGAIEAINRLRQTNLQIKFVSNTSKESQKQLHTRLTYLGFKLEPSEIITSLSSTRNLVEKRKLKPLLLLSPEAMEDFEGLGCPPGQKPDSVVVGLAPTEFHYEKLNEAFKCLVDGGQLIAAHIGKYYKRPEGLSLGPGCFVKGLEYSAQCKAEVVGKPTQKFFQAALGNIPPESAVMIGDDVDDDILGAMQAGLKGYLVQTGKYRAGDENKISPSPSGVFANIKDAVNNIIELLSKDSYGSTLKLSISKN